LRINLDKPLSEDADFEQLFFDLALKNLRGIMWRCMVYKLLICTYEAINFPLLIFFTILKRRNDREEC